MWLYDCFIVKYGWWWWWAFDIYTWVISVKIISFFNHSLCWAYFSINLR